MESKNLKITLFISLFLALILAPFAEASISLGTAVNKEDAQVFPGESATFKIFFFNIREDFIHLQLESEHPEGWDIIITPEELNLPLKELGDLTPEEGYEFLGTGMGDVKARPVIVRVDIPEHANPGDYKVKVSVSAGGGGGVLSVHQLRNFYFDIGVMSTHENEQKNQTPDKEGTVIEDDIKEGHILGNETGEAGQVYEEGAKETGSQDTLTGMIAINPHIFLIVFTIVLIIGCWVYYRHE